MAEIQHGEGDEQGVGDESQESGEQHEPHEGDERKKLSGPEARAERVAARLARQISTFARRHGGTEGHLAHLGQAGTRIVLVGADGRWGDLVAPSDAVARSAVATAGITLHESFDGEFAASVRTGPYEWRRMAGIQIGGRARG